MERPVINGYESRKNVITQVDKHFALNKLEPRLEGKVTKARKGKHCFTLGRINKKTWQIRGMTNIEL
jgi:hypothetical protein